MSVLLLQLGSRQRPVDTIQQPLLLFGLDKIVEGAGLDAFDSGVDLVETQFGFHIIKLTDMKTAGATTFDDEKAKIMEMLESGKEREFAKTYIEDVKSKAKVTWSEGYAPAPMAMPPM